LSAQKLAGATALCSGGSDQQLYLRLWPHRHQTDGFFAAAWQKE
jgi:16S rRNA (cytosine967-C5)-methyltransferase